MNTFSLNPRDGDGGSENPDRLIVFRGRKYLTALSLWMHAIIGGERRGGGKMGMDVGTEGLSLSITAPKMRAFESKFMGCGPIEGGWKRGRERTIANLRCLVWSIAAER